MTSLAALCQARIAKEMHFRYFGDRKHRFYLEYRCQNACMEESRVCEKCVIKEVVKIQGSRRYDHGRMTHPIPAHSHLYGSVWYEKGVELWGAPTPEDIECAQQHQRIARGIDTSKVLPVPSSIAMPRPRKKAIAPQPEENVSGEPLEEKDPTSANEPVSVKKRRPRMTKVPITPMEPIPSTEPVSESAAILALFFPKEATLLPTTPKEATLLPTTPKEETSSAATSSAATSSAATSSVQTEKRRKPRVTKKKEEVPQPEEKKEEEQEQEPQEEKPKKTRAKRTTKPQKSQKSQKSQKPVKESSSSQPTHQDSCIPTHLEHTMEPHRLDDYEVEYVPLTIFIYDNVVYFRDAPKNKLYRRVKEKTAGPYVGRYDAATDAILTDIPDSDEESSE